MFVLLPLLGLKWVYDCITSKSFNATWRHVFGEVVASGTMVMNSQQQVDQAVRDYQSGAFGVPWGHTLDDEQWQRHTGSGV